MFQDTTFCFSYIRIVNIHTFTQCEFLSRHVTNRNNHNHHVYTNVRRCAWPITRKMNWNNSECLRATSVWRPASWPASKSKPRATAVCSRALYLGSSLYIPVCMSVSVWVWVFERACVCARVCVCECECLSMWVSECVCNVSHVDKAVIRCDRLRYF